MTADLSQLPAILDRLTAQQSLSKQEQEILALALQRGQITLSGEERAVAIGGNADNAVIVTGDRNILISKELGEALQAKIQGAGNVEQQFGTTNYNFFLLGNDASAIQAQQQQQQQVSLLLQEIPLKALQRAYRDVLPADAYVARPQMTNPEEIVANLQDFRRLPDFVQQIVADEQQPQLIRDKLSETIGLPKTSQPIAKTSVLLQSYLLITVRRKQDGDGFVVNGWLIPDDTVRDGAQRFHPLDNPLSSIKQRKKPKALLHKGFALLSFSDSQN